MEGENRSIENGDVYPYDLSPAQVERLACLAEEAGEIVQIVGKILRHGWNSYNPYDEDRVHNKKLLQRELADLEVIVEMMENSGDITLVSMSQNMALKKNSLKKYLHYNKI